MFSQLLPLDAKRKYYNFDDSNFNENIRFRNL